jgi:membrane protein YqaA with SNARE-associated domain
MSLSARPNAIWALAGISFIESSFFPIPPDLLLIPMLLAARSQSLKIAMVCTVASVVGGMFGYAIGFYLYDGIGRPLLDFYGYTAKFEDFQVRYNDWGAWIVFIAGAGPAVFCRGSTSVVDWPADPGIYRKTVGACLYGLRGSAGWWFRRAEIAVLIPSEAIKTLVSCNLSG